MMPDPTPHEPTHKTRAEVSALTSFGHTQEEIAAHLYICVDTLVKYYRDELDNSVVRSNAKVASKLFKKAVDQEDLTAIIFWLKTRARWRERDHVDVFDQNAKMLEEIRQLRAELDAKNLKEY